MFLNLDLRDTIYGTYVRRPFGSSDRQLVLSYSRQKRAYRGNSPYNYPISPDTACICFLYCFRIGNRLHIIAASLHTDPRRQTLINTPFLTPQFTTVLYLSVHRVCDSLHSQRPDITYRGEPSLRRHIYSLGLIGCFFRRDRVPWRVIMAQVVAEPRYL